MTARPRSCLTCRHYEPSAIWRRGWCRNPRLYAPQQSHLVDQDSLDCARGLGDSWQPAEGGGESKRSGSVRGERRPLMVFGPQPRLAGAVVGAGSGAGAGMMASTNLGGGSGPGGPAGGAPPPSGGPPRPDRGLPPSGQERTISFQPEERYWTDYLRILLPVAGLLLLIGLLWWWLDFVIGDSTSEPPPPPQTVGVVSTEIIEPAVSTPGPVSTPATVAVNAGPVPTATAIATVAAAPPAADTAATETPTAGETPPPAGPEQDFPTYSVGDSVVTDDEGVNLRAEASADSASLGALELGAPLTVRGDFVPFEEPELDWWPVTTADGREGFIREDFLEPAPST